MIKDMYTVDSSDFLCICMSLFSVENVLISIENAEQMLLKWRQSICE